MPSEDDFYELVDDIYSRDEFEEIIEKKDRKYDGLFTRDVLAHLIVAENGRNRSMIKDIKELEAGEEATIEGKVVDLGSLRRFNKNGNEGKVRNVRIDDGTGTIKLVLWNEETDRVGDDITRDTELKIINGYVQDRGYGLQIQAGKWGEVRVIEGEND